MKHGVSGAIVSAVAGFSLASAVLAANLEPDSWVPTVDETAIASVTVVDVPAADEVLRDRDSEIAAAPRLILRLTRSVPRPVAQPAQPTAEVLQVPQIPSELGIPGIVLDAYRQAAVRLADRDASCNLDWPVLAGIGKIESGHARNGQVGADGTTFEPILGPVLDGDGFAAIPDTDNGLLDGDAVWDRAVGPMQFIPGTWLFVGADGNADGVESPHNIFDAALSAGAYVCAGSRDLSDRGDLALALRSYNNSSAYVAVVLAWIDGYRDGRVTPLPPQPTPPPGTTAPPTTPPGTTVPPTTAPPTTGPPTTTPPPTSPPTTPPTPPPTTSEPTPSHTETTPPAEPPPTTPDPTSVPPTSPAGTAPVPSGD